MYNESQWSTVYLPTFFKISSFVFHRGMNIRFGVTWWTIPLNGEDTTSNEFPYYWIYSICVHRPAWIIVPQQTRHTVKTDVLAVNTSSVIDDGDLMREAKLAVQMAVLRWLTSSKKDIIRSASKAPIRRIIQLNTVYKLTGTYVHAVWQLNTNKWC